MAKIPSTLLFLTQNDQILLAMKKEGHGTGLYNGVGGKIEADETVEQALIRECVEEIGVTPIKYYKVAENNFSWPNEKGKQAGFFTHIYICEQWRDNPHETKEMAPQWFKTSDIPYDNMWQVDRFWLPQVLAGHKVKGVFTFDKDFAILSHKVNKVRSF